MNKKPMTFERVMARLKAQVGPEVFTSWFGRLKLQSASKSVVRLSVPTAFLKSWINNKYLDQISALVREEAPDILKVEIVVRSATRASRQYPETATDAASNSSQASRPPASGRKDRMSRSRVPARSFDLSTRGHRQPTRDRIAA
jgi:chromosomal replication initiator protein